MALAERIECYWLLDVIVSYQPQLKNEEFQVWKLTVNEDSSAIVECTDCIDNVLKTQKIPYTDFNAKEVTIWVAGDVMLLPLEH